MSGGAAATTYSQKKDPAGMDRERAKGNTIDVTVQYLREEGKAPGNGRIKRDYHIYKGMRLSYSVPIA